MLLDIVLFPLFLLALYTLGAGVLRARRVPGEEDYPTYYYLVSALLFLGFLSVAVNFFAGVSSPITYAILTVVLLLGASRIRRADFDEIKSLLWFGVFLSPFGMAPKPQDDAGLYHIPHQLWIHDEKIVLGLANFHDRFGFNSLLEYISAPLWVGEHFKLLAYLLATFVLLLLLFLRDALKEKQATVAAFGFLTALGLIINSNYLEFKYASTDTSTGIIFAMAYFSGLFLLLKENAPAPRQLSMFFFLALFCFALKASGILLALWVFFVVAWLLHQKRVELPVVVRRAVPPFALGILWLACSIAVSGCLLFPLAASCIRELPWSAWENARTAEITVTAWARHNGAGLSYAYEGWAWITNWWLAHNWVFCSGIALVVALVCLAYRRMFTVPAVPQPWVMRGALAFVMVALGFWFYKAPTPRFGIGVFMMLPASVAVTWFGLRELGSFALPAWVHKVPYIPIRKMVQTKGIVQGLGTLVIFALVCKFSGYMAYQAVRSAKHNGFGFQTLAAPTVITHPDANFGVKSEDSFCWTAPHCGWPAHPAISEFQGYQYFGG